MGSVTTTVLAGLSALSAVSSIAGGISANKEAGKQAELAALQAEQRATEQERVSFKQSQAELEEADSLSRRQKVAFLASGVDLAGSPLLVMEETRRKGAENAEEILKSGEYGATASRAEGRATASQLRASGRQALLGGLSNAAGTAATGITRYQDRK